MSSERIKRNMSAKKTKKAPAKKQGDYEVLRPFKYDGKDYKRGERWSPSGGKYDEPFIAQAKYVLPVSGAEKTTKAEAPKAEVNKDG